MFFEVVDSVVELRDPSSAAPSTKPGHSYAQFLIKLNSFSFTSKRLKIRFSLQSPSEANDTKDSLETKQIIHERQKCHNPWRFMAKILCFSGTSCTGTPRKASAAKLPYNIKWERLTPEIRLGSVWRFCHVPDTSRKILPIPCGSNIEIQVVYLSI